MTPSKMIMVVTFRNGVQINADVEEFSTGRSVLDSDLKTLKWKLAENPNLVIHWLDLHEVVAIHALLEYPEEDQTTT